MYKSNIVYSNIQLDIFPSSFVIEVVLWKVVIIRDEIRPKDVTLDVRKKIFRVV